MADEPSRSGNAKPTDPSKPRIEPDQPTPNRDKRRQPITIDLKADPPKPSDAKSAETKPGENAPASAAASSAGAPGNAGQTGTGTYTGSVGTAATDKPAETSAGTASAEPPKPSVAPAAPMAEPPKPEAFKTEAAKPEPSKPEPPKPDPAKPETPKSEPSRPATAKVDDSRLGTGPKATAVPPAPPSPRGGMAMPLLASVICAAIVAAAVVYAYQTITGQGQVLEALRTQVAALHGRLDAVDKQVASVPQASALTAMEAGFDKKLGAADAARAQSAAASEERLRKLETIRNEVTGALEKRVGSLEALTTTLGAQIDQANTKAEVVRIQAARAVEAVAKASATPPGAPIILPPTVDVAPINARLKEVEAKLKTVEATLAKPKADARATEVRAVVPSPKADPANVAIVAQALVRAFDQGTPYTSELATLEALGAGDKAAAMKPFAEHGAPKTAELTAQFAALRPAILAAAAPPPSGGFLDRLSSGASGLISVRPTGEAAATGTSPAALVGQIDTALGRADPAAALAAWAKLPPAGQKVSLAWADRLKAREAARQAAQSLMSESVAALAKPKS